MHVIYFQCINEIRDENSPGRSSLCGGVPLLLAQAELQGGQGLENLHFSLLLTEARNKAGAERWDLSTDF